MRHRIKPSSFINNRETRKKAEAIARALKSRRKFHFFLGGVTFFLQCFPLADHWLTKSKYGLAKRDKIIQGLRVGLFL